MVQSALKNFKHQHGVFNGKILEAFHIRCNAVLVPATKQKDHKLSETRFNENLNSINQQLLHCLEIISLLFLANKDVGRL